MRATLVVEWDRRQILCNLFFGLFIDYLPKGTYVFEYPVKVFHRGRYQTGIANIQSMYAPEFNSHSASHWLEVK